MAAAPAGWKGAFWEACKGDRDVSGMDTETSWDEVEWSAEREAVAQQLLAGEEGCFSAELRDKYEAEAGEHWERFYAHFKDNFFKDRNYLQGQFPELTPGALPAGNVVMEVGCGVGNTLVPLCQLLPEARFVGLDISPSAVAIMQGREGWDATRCTGGVCDVSEPGALAAAVPSGSVNIATSVFTLSAISPARLPTAISAIYDALAPGGCLLFRDYGVSDMTQVRFVTKTGRKIEDNFYLRGDGTRVHYMSRESATKAFEAAGFQVERIAYDTRELRNRKRMIKMYRVWLTAKFVKPLLAPESKPVVNN